MLTVNDRPTLEGARQVLVETLEDEGRLRNLAWIEHNRRRVDEASGGRIGYVYVPDTGVHGQNELVRQFRSQFTREGLIVDERFNNGGFGPDRMIELLNRPVSHYRAVRNGPDWQDPDVGHAGPKAMLINSWSGSGGDMFPWAFRQAGLGPLIGTRTWGGVIGISGAPGLIDGGGVTVPTHGTYDLEGNWVMEGYGVDPDVEVQNDPTSMARGEDPQLERAVAEVLRMLDESPPRRPAKPAYPVIPGN
jgi:tricorn protease